MAPPALQHSTAHPQGLQHSLLCPVHSEMSNQCLGPTQKTFCFLVLRHESHCRSHCLSANLLLIPVTGLCYAGMAHLTASKQHQLKTVLRCCSPKEGKTGFICYPCKRGVMSWAASNQPGGSKEHPMQGCAWGCSALIALSGFAPHLLSSASKPEPSEAFLYVPPPHH